MLETFPEEMQHVQSDMVPMIDQSRDKTKGLPGELRSCIGVIIGVIQEQRQLMTLRQLHH